MVLVTELVIETPIGEIVSEPKMPTEATKNVAKEWNLTVKNAGIAGTTGIWVSNDPSSPGNIYLTWGIGTGATIIPGYGKEWKPHLASGASITKSGKITFKTMGYYLIRLIAGHYENGVFITDDSRDIDG